MVIKVLENKFNTGNNRGYGIDIPNLVLKLNLIIDRNKSTWPESKKTKELEEGDVFVLEGTVFGVDHDRLVQIVSETGFNAFKRIYHENIEPEIEFSNDPDDGNIYSWKELEELPENQDYQEYTIPYPWMKLWKEKFVENQNIRSDYTIEIEVRDGLFDFSRHIYIKPSGVYYLESDFSEDELKYFLHNAFCSILNS